MTSALVLSADCSTTSCKAIVWDATGREVSEARQSFPLHNPEPDGYEQDANDWKAALFGSVSRAVARLSPEQRSAICAICVTHQRETFVLTDRSGVPLLPALVWMDSRCREDVSRATQALGAEAIHRVSGKPACTTPSLYKLMYLLRRHPEVQRREPMVLDVHAFLVHALTGRFATSLASADPLGMLDMSRGSWAPELLELASVDSAQLPALVAPGTLLGPLRPSAANACGLPAGIPVIAGAGDGQAAGLGAGITGPGRAYLNLGTAIVSGVLSQDYVVDGAFRTMYGAAPQTFFLETDLKGGTFTVNWLVERLLGGGPEELAELEAHAQSLGAGSGGLLLVPYLNAVMNPYWDDDATGVLLGLDGSQGASHLYRAILEGIALEQRLHSRAVEAASASRIEEFVVMGGGSESELFCQIAADVLERPVVRARSAQATSLGAAILAAVAAGVHADVTAAVRSMTADGQRFDPGPSKAVYSRLFDVYAGLYPALKTSMHRLRELSRRPS